MAILQFIKTLVMKKIILLVSLFMSLGAIAQIKKGAILIGGAISGGTNKSNATQLSQSNEQKSNSINFSPGIGYAFKKNVITGVKLSLGKSKYESINANITTSKNEFTAYGGGFFVRNYLPVFGKFQVFAETDLGYANSKQTITNGMGINEQKQESNTNIIGLNFSPGMAFAVSKKFQVELYLGNILGVNYNQSTAKIFSGSTITGESSSSGVGYSLNASTFNNLSVGFRILLD
jgi:hypothetical protein